MVISCCVAKCNTNSSKEIFSFYRVPSEISKNNKKFAIRVNGNKHDIVNLSKIRREKWLQVLQLSNVSESKLNNLRICEKHFVSSELNIKNIYIYFN